MPEALVTARCHHHRHREAAARCPECLRFYCRECVTEHESKVICGRCLRRLAEAGAPGPPARRWAAHAARGAVGALLLWLLYYSLGQLLMLIPSTFHEGIT